MEAAVIDRNSKSIIEKNKQNVRKNEIKYNKLERQDLLSRKELHEDLKKQRSDYRMNKELEQQMAEETLEKRANQINTAVQGYMKSQNDKESENQAEEDAFYKED